MTSDEKRWRFDRTLSIVAIAGWLGLAVGGIWWLAKLDAQVGANANWILQNGNLSARLASIETKLEFIIESMRRQP